MKAIFLKLSFFFLSENNFFKGEKKNKCLLKIIALYIIFYIPWQHRTVKEVNGCMKMAMMICSVTGQKPKEIVVKMYLK